MQVYISLKKYIYQKQKKMKKQHTNSETLLRKWQHFLNKYVLFV